MIDFDYFSPTKICFGRGKVKQVGDLLRERGISRVLIVIGRNSARMSGLLDRVVNYLGSGISHWLVEGVRPNPKADLVRLGVRIAKEHDVQGVLAVGGGSVIDTAKAIAAGFYYDGDPFDFNLYKAKVRKALPIGVILTIAASGSEVSNSAVIADDETKRKQGFNSELIRPSFAIMDPVLTITVSKFQTGCGVVDIVSHSLERYFSPSGPDEFADNLALAIIKNMVEVGKTCVDDPHDVDARAEMMLTGSYSHIGITSLGKRALFIIHKIEHALSASHPRIAHGAGLAVLIPAWMEFARESDLAKFVKFARVVFDIREEDPEKCALLGIRTLRSFFDSLGMPSTLAELGLSEDDIPMLADLLTDRGSKTIGRGSIKPLNREDVIRIFGLVARKEA